MSSRRRLTTSAIALLFLVTSAALLHELTSAAPSAVTMNISAAAGPDGVAARSTVEAQDDSWRSAASTAGATSFQQISLSSITGTPNPATIYTNGSFSIQAANRQLSSAQVSTPNSIGDPDTPYELGTSSTLQDNSPRPSTLYNTSGQPPYWNQLGGSASTRNAILFTFSQPIVAFGAWFGDLETRPTGGVAAIVRLLDTNGNPIGSDIVVQPTETANQATCSAGAVGCGNQTTRWIGFVADRSTLVKQMLIVVGDEDTPGTALTERISFIGPTLALSNIGPLAVELAGFSAYEQDQQIVVEWETNSELNNRGFHLWRSTSPDAPETRLNDQLIASYSPGSPAGYFYTWEDSAGLVTGTTYYYWLETLDTDGAIQQHGPVSAPFGVPTAVQLAAQGSAPTPGLHLIALSVSALLGILTVLVGTNRRSPSFVE